MKKRLVTLLLSALMVLGVAGCGADDELNTLRSLQVLNSESTITDYKMTWGEKQSFVYAQVSDRTLLDLSRLESCSDNELQAVQNYMNNVDNQLIGSIPAQDGVIDKCFTDYLLVEFEQTPSYWQRSQMIVRGKDAESGAIICDVTYKTIGFEKEVIPVSTIPLGADNYDKQMMIRFQRWSSIMAQKYGNSNKDYRPDYTEFVQIYGEPEDILAGQTRDSLTDNIYQTGNQITYTGLIDSDEEKVGAEMVVRYILVPNYVLGINLGLNCEHMYQVSYNIGSDPTDGKELFTEEGYQTVTESVYNMLHSYFQCTDEDDYRGLYNLTTSFEGIDKYWQDLFRVAYRKHNNFTLDVYGITGTHIICDAKVSTQIRAKGSDMTMPMYTDKYYFEIELVDGELKVTNMVLVKRDLVGEPAITTDHADMTGFVASVDLDNEDKVAIEKLICDYSQLQLLQDVTSDKFGEVVDLSMSSASMNNLQDNMLALTGDKKVVWLQTYMEGTPNYAAVKCKELFQDADNTIVEASAVYDFIRKGAKWYVYGYNLTNQARLDTTNLATMGNLCVVEPSGIVSYTSQVTNTVGTTDLDNLTDVSVAYEYDEYTPVLKSGVVEQGKNVITEEEMTDEVLAEYAATMSERAAGMTDWESVVEAYTNLNLDGVYLFKQGIVIYYNKVENLYTDDMERRNAVSDWNAKVEEWHNGMTEQLAGDKDTLKIENDFHDLLRNMGRSL